MKETPQQYTQRIVAPRRKEAAGGAGGYGEEAGTVD
jgi:hypothetical protein